MLKASLVAYTNMPQVAGMTPSDLPPELCTVAQTSVLFLILPYQAVPALSMLAIDSEKLEQ